MGDRVEGQLAEELRGPIPEAVGREGVEELMDGERDQEEEREDDDRVERLLDRVDAHLQSAQQVGLLGFVFLGADRAAIAQIREVRERPR